MKIFLRTISLNSNTRQTGKDRDPSMIDWKFLLTTLFGAIACFFSYYAGTKQTDRPALQELYRKLLAHFRDLRRHLDFCPIRSSEYDIDFERLHPADTVRTITPLENIQRNGEDARIGIRTFKDMLSTERDCLDYGDLIDTFYDEYFEALRITSEKHNIPFEKLFPESETLIFLLRLGVKAPRPLGCIPQKLFAFCEEDTKEQIVESLNKYHFAAFYSDRYPEIYRLEVGTNSDYTNEELADLLVACAKSCKSHRQIIQQRSGLTKRLDALIHTLEKRAKEPTAWGLLGVHFIRSRQH